MNENIAEKYSGFLRSKSTLNIVFECNKELMRKIIVKRCRTSISIL